MNTCPTCAKTFKANWILQRHLNRKNKCRPVYTGHPNDIGQHIEQIDIDLKETQKELETTKDIVKTISESLGHAHDLEKCKYCKKLFSFRKNLIRHESSCKAKIDNVDIYERELCIEPNECDKLTCRFCSQTYRNLSSFSKHKNKGCIAKVKYEAELEKRVIANRAAAAQRITNNIHNGDNTIIINLPPMRPFGRENLDYLTTKLLLDELEKCKKLNQSDITGIVDRFTKLIHANPAHPENQNVLFKSLNSGFARVYNGEKFEDRQSTEIEDTVLQTVGTAFSTKCCDQYKEEKNEMMDVLDDLDSNFGDRSIDLKNNENSRALSKCRNVIKAALHSNKEQIATTHELIKK